MGLFNNDNSIKTISDILLKYEERQEHSHAKLISAIDALRVDLNDLATKLISMSGDYNVKMLELKQDILNVCYEEMALKRELRETAISLDSRIKAIRREAWIVYTTLLSGALLLAWLIDHKLISFGVT